MRILIVILMLTSSAIADDGWLSKSRAERHGEWFAPKDSKDRWFRSEPKSKPASSSFQRTDLGLNTVKTYIIDNSKGSDRFIFRGKVYQIAPHLRKYPKLQLRVYEPIRIDSRRFPRFQSWTEM